MGRKAPMRGLEMRLGEVRVRDAMIEKCVDWSLWTVWTCGEADSMARDGDALLHVRMHPMTEIDSACEKHE